MVKVKVGITGQSGFVGTHLFNTLNLDKKSFQIIHFEDKYFSDNKLLEEWVADCDVIVHLAAVNRHNDPHFIYETNISLIRQLISALENTRSQASVIFSSSTQEEYDNVYGNSKKEGREIFEKWAETSNTKFSSLIIPNVFGPFGKPYYNSVVATFCHQLTHNEIPKVEVDNEIKLIYVGELVDCIIEQINSISGLENNAEHIKMNYLKPSALVSVSELLKKIEYFKLIYFDQGFIPDLNNDFEKNLFNTFLCYIDHGRFFPFKLHINSDRRGSFVEIARTHSGGQMSFSTTIPGITRGNHFHTRKAERFAVIKGKAVIELRKIGTDEVLSFVLNGENPAFVDMPVWFTHNIKNTGEEELLTIFWTNEFFDPTNTDTYFEDVNKRCEND